MEKAFVAYQQLLKMPSRCRRANAGWEDLPEPRRKALVDTLERRFVSQDLLAKWLLESNEDDEATSPRIKKKRPRFRTIVRIRNGNGHPIRR